MTKADVTASPLPYGSFRTDSCPDMLTVGLSHCDRRRPRPGSKSKLNYLPLPQDDPKQRQPDITLASKLLKWRPTVPLREELGRTIGYFDRVLSATDPLRMPSETQLRLRKIRPRSQPNSLSKRGKAARPGE